LKEATNSFSWDSKSVRNDVLFLGLLYFLLTTVYSLIHYQEKFILDGYSHIFHIANYKSFVSAAQREIMYLQQLIPVIVANLGGSLKAIMISYVLSVHLLYVLAFLILTLFFKDLYSSILLVLIHFKGIPYNCFMMVEELLPGACCVILFLSAIRNFDRFKSRVSVVLFLSFMLLLIVRSHPIAIVCLAVTAPLLLFTNRQFFIRERKIVFSGIVILGVIAGAKFLFLNSYDLQTLSNMKSIKGSFTELLDTKHLTDIFFYIFYTRNIFTILFIVLFLFLYSQKNYKAILTILLLLFVGLVVFNMTVTHEVIYIHDLGVRSYDTRSLQIRMLIFAAFSFFVLPAINDWLYYRATKSTLILLSVIGLLQTFSEQKYSIGYLDQAKSIIENSRKEGVSKVAVRLSDLNGLFPVHANAYRDIMVISSLENSKATVQVVYIDDKNNPDVSDIQPDEILLDLDGDPINIEELDSGYFTVNKEPYTMIDMKEEDLGQRKDTLISNE